jgi:hypothetical protein
VQFFEISLFFSVDSWPIALKIWVVVEKGVITICFIESWLHFSIIGVVAPKRMFFGITVVWDEIRWFNPRQK